MACGVASRSGSASHSAVRPCAGLNCASHVPLPVHGEIRNKLIDPGRIDFGTSSTTKTSLIIKVDSLGASVLDVLKGNRNTKSKQLLLMFSLFLGKRNKLVPRVQNR